MALLHMALTETPPPAGATTDVALVAALRRREARAFDELYRRYHVRLWRFLVRLGGTHVAEDLFQDTWLAVAKHAANLKDDTDFAAWIFTIARNRFLSHRRWAFVDRVRREWFGKEPSMAVVEPERAAVARQETVRLEHALETLAPIHREVLLLVVVEGLTTEQVGKILDLQNEAVRKRLSRARAALAERLEERP
ncbi:RNA polymerase sigma factor [Pendulispora rubella]|uniref:RNA polymerase sigma factor n=1 Tax=Pendulispora rubella TaxID=2741070 RepID=A0ABZ2LGR4_9BACT